MFGHNQQREGPGPLPPPWYAEWDERDRRWVYINPQNGERTFEHPHPNYNGGGGSGGYGGGGYGGGGGGYGGPGRGYEGEQRGYGGGGYGGGYEQPPPHHKDHSGMKYGAMGAVGGLVAGAFAMHEGEKIHDKFEYDKDRLEGDFDYDKDRIENRVDYDARRAEQGIEDFPDDAARWAGRQEERVEDFPDDAARWAGREEQRIDDIPEDMAGWAGRKVGDVERFDDGVENAFDYGRDEQRYDDENRW